MAGRARIIAIVVVLLLIVGVAVYFATRSKPAPVTPAPVATTTPVVETIGTSVEGRAITAYSYGTGAKRIVFAGGMHGGYEWNSVLLAYQFKDYLDAHPEFVPAALTITVIPSINPDGVFAAVGHEGRFTAEEATTSAAALAAARFNAHDVDLNRNFGCHWQATSTWQAKTVSAGTAAFSEPEAAAIRDYALKYTPTAFVFWHSQANAVYASECDEGVLPGTLAVMNAYAKAAGYPAVASFDAYPITGDSEGWLASIHIPAVTVELSSHTSIEWDRNLAGIKALLALYSQPVP